MHIFTFVYSRGNRFGVHVPPSNVSSRTSRALPVCLLPMCFLAFTFILLRKSEQNKTKRSSVWLEIRAEVPSKGCSFFRLMLPKDLINHKKEESQCLSAAPEWKWNTALIPQHQHLNVVKVVVSECTPHLGRVRITCLLVSKPGG